MDISQPGTSSQPEIIKLFTPVDNKKRKHSISPDKPIPKKPVETKTTNRYTPLQSDIDTDNDDTDDDDNNMQTTTQTKPPTPIIFPGKLTQPTPFINTIKNIANNNFHLKHTSNTVSVFFKNKEDKDTYIQHINKTPDTYKYYTYTEKSEKSHAYVLRGLDSAPDTHEIDEDLKRQGLTTRNIFKMKTSHRPLYLIITDNKTTLKHITHTIKYILYTKITWERHTNKKTLTQCHRCQEWGHATSNCRLDPKCLKCSENHLTKDCKILDTEKPTCANCGGEHTANNVACPTYQRIMELKQKTQNKNQRRQPPKPENTPAFIPAPIPESNIWKMRAAQRQMEQAPPTTTTTTSTAVPPTAPPLPTQRPPSVNTTSDNYSDIHNLFSIVDSINKKINIKQMVIAMGELDRLLNNTSTPAHSALVFMDFISTIEKYNIKP